MAEVDWTELSDDLDLASLDRGVTSGIARPNGGGSFLFGFNSLATSPGAAGYFTNQANFAPTPANKGGSVRGAIKRGAGAGAINFAPMLYIGLQGASVNDAGYILGLEDNEPHRIVLRKATLVAGLPAAVAGQDSVLRVSTPTFAQDTWLHLRLDMVVNLTGDVILKCWQNDLVANPVTAPVWAAIDGMTDFVDDALGVNSTDAGVPPALAQPFTNGRMGYAFQTADVTRRGFFDHVRCLRQL